MKKWIALLLALTLTLSMTAALADGRTAPEDKKVITTDDLGVDTVFKKYDAKFYDAASEQPGEVVRVEYTTTAYGDERTNYVNVYLPYGYDETKQYNIIYFLHGTNETQESFIGDERAKNALDNMIEVGIAEPFIMVFPTYYYDYENRAIDVAAFRSEMRNDIMPAVESRFSTYAPTADTEGFIASREHRAMSGYSRGSYMTWHLMNGMLDTARWWIPMSAAISGEDEMQVPGPDAADQVVWLENALASQPGYDYYIYICCGGPRDAMYDYVNGLVSAMAQSSTFSYGRDPSVNNFCYCLSQEIHQTLIGRLYFYNAFELIFK